MDTNKKNRKGSTYVDPRSDKAVSRRPHAWTPPKGTGGGPNATRSKHNGGDRPTSQIKELVVEQRFDSTPIRAAAGYEVHQIEREGSVIGYVSRPENGKDWAMTLPDGTELSRPAGSLEEAGEALVVADDQIVYNKYPDFDYEENKKD